MGSILSQLRLVGIYGYSWAVSKFGVAAVKIALITAGVIGGIIAGAGVGFVVYYLGTNRVFY